MSKPNAERLEDRTAPAVLGGVADPLDFGSEQYPNVSASEILPSGDGFLVAGNVERQIYLGASPTQLFVSRLESDSALDADYGTNGRTFLSLPEQPVTFLSGFVALPDGGALVLATSSFVGDVVLPDRDEAVGVFKLDARGALDQAFGDGGLIVLPSESERGAGVVSLPDGGVMVLAATSDKSAPTALYRLTAGGKLDGDRIALDLPYPQFLLPRPAGDFLAVGSMFDAGSTVARIDPFGTVLDKAQIDTSSTLNAAAVTPDGGLVVTSSAYIEGASGLVTRLLPDLTPDPSFGTDGEVLLELTTGVYPQSFENVVVLDGGGLLLTDTTQVSVDPQRSYPVFARLTPAGQLDATFFDKGFTTVELFGDINYTTAAGVVPLDGGEFLAVLNGQPTTRTPGTILELRSAVAVLANSDPVPTGEVPPNILVVGGEPGGRIRTYRDGSVTPLDDIDPFPSVDAITRGTAVDVDGDGTLDRVYAVGPGGGSALRVVTSTGTDVTINVFEDTFTGGLFLAAGDFDGDGKSELFATPDEGGGGRVVGYRLVGGKLVVFANFFGIDDVNFRGGARVALADMTGDGVPEVLVAAGTGGGPRVALFDGADVVAAGTSRTPVKRIDDFFAFEQSLRNGVYVAMADYDGDAVADLVFGGGPGGGSRVTVVSGTEVLGGRVTPLQNFFAFDAESRGGVRLAATDSNGDDRADLAVGDGSTGAVRLLDGTDLTGDGVEFTSFDAASGGVFVG